MYDYDLFITDYAYKNDVPVLGICLGMQLMGVLFGGEMIDVDNHKKKLSYVHSVSINKKSIRIHRLVAFAFCENKYNK